MKIDLKTPNEHLKSLSIDSLDILKYTEVEQTFSLVFNFLNDTSNIDYSPFSFMKPLFEFDNKEHGDDISKWTIKYSSFKFQLKKIIPFTIKFL